VLRRSANEIGRLRQRYGRKNTNAYQCQERCYDIHDATCFLCWRHHRVRFVPEFFVRSGKVFRENRRRWLSSRMFGSAPASSSKRAMSIAPLTRVFNGTPSLPFRFAFRGCTNLSQFGSR